jgi:hypothetical protein
VWKYSNIVEKDVVAIGIEDDEALENPFVIRCNKCLFIRNMRLEVGHHGGGLASDQRDIPRVRLFSAMPDLLFITQSRFSYQGTALSHHRISPSILAYPCEDYCRRVSTSRRGTISPIYYTVPLIAQT